MGIGTIEVGSKKELGINGGQSGRDDPSGASANNRATELNGFFLFLLSISLAGDGGHSTSH